MVFGFKMVHLLCAGRYYDDRYRFQFLLKCYGCYQFFILLAVLTFGFSTILMHYGVFVEDLANITTIGLKLVFYLSGIFYSIEKIRERVPAPFNSLIIDMNPVAVIIINMEKCIVI